MSMTDKELNKLMGGVASMPTLDTSFRKQLKPLISSTIQNGKGYKAGSIYSHSPYIPMIEKFANLSDSFTTVDVEESKPLNEGDEVFINNVIDFIAYVENGDAAENYEPLYIELPTFEEAKKRVEAGYAPSNAVETLLSYKKKVHEADKPIKELKNKLLERHLSITKKELLNPSKHSLDWLVSKTQPDEKIVDLAASYQFEKKMVISEHKARTESLSNHEHPLYSAYLFARLYRMTHTEQLLERKKNAPRVLKVLKEKEITRLNEGRLPGSPSVLLSSEKVAELNALSEMAPFSENGYASILTLFPLGAVQILEFFEHKKIKTVAQKGQNLFCYLEPGKSAPGEALNKLSEEDIALWHSLEGQKVVIENGTIQGLFVQEQYMYSEETSRRKPSESHIKHRPEMVQSVLREMDFLTGSSVWLGGKVEGVLMCAKPYASGVAAYFVNMKQV